MINNIVAIGLCACTLFSLALGCLPLGLFFLMLQIIFMFIVISGGFKK